MAVYKRGKSWVIDIVLGGQRINRKAGDTKQQALQAEAELKTRWRLKQLHLVDLRDDVLPFPELAGEYFRYSRGVKARKTWEVEENYYKNHIEPILKDLCSSDLTDAFLLNYQAALSAAGLSNRTVNILLGIVRKILNHAADKKLIARPVLKWPRLREAKRHHAFLTIDEYNRLLSHLDSPMTKARIIFARHTGLRPAELSWLSWADVDIEGRTVKVQGKEGWKPKTDEERVIPLNDTASDILTTLCKTRKGPWVFSRGEKPVLDIKKAILTAGRAAGIDKRVTANMLRHSFATHALMAGGDIQAVQAILGHKELETTARYTHALTDSIRRTVGLLEESPDKVPTPKKKASRKRPLSD